MCLPTSWLAAPRPRPSRHRRRASSPAACRLPRQTGAWSCARKDGARAALDDRLVEESPGQRRAHQRERLGPPPDSPKISTLFGSPPNAAMFAWTHCSDAMRCDAIQRAVVPGDLLFGFGRGRRMRHVADRAPSAVHGARRLSGAARCCCTGGSSVPVVNPLHGRRPSPAAGRSSRARRSRRSDAGSPR
jgi:hypothetical protein